VDSTEVHHWIRALFQIVIGMFPVENYSAFQARIRKGKKKTIDLRHGFVVFFGWVMIFFFDGDLNLHRVESTILFTSLGGCCFVSLGPISFFSCILVELVTFLWILPWIHHPLGSEYV